LQWFEVSPFHPLSLPPDKNYSWTLYHLIHLVYKNTTLSNYLFQPYYPIQLTYMSNLIKTSGWRSSPYHMNQLVWGKLNYCSQLKYYLHSSNFISIIFSLI
jgi:hypothetical protein